MFKCLHHAQKRAQKQENTGFAVGFVEEMKSAEFIFDWLYILRDLLMNYDCCDEVHSIQPSENQKLAAL